MMPRLCANLSMLFADLPFLQRFEAARQAGFHAVECQFPYAESVDEVARALRYSGLRLVLHNLPAGNWAQGERGIACHPGRVAEFREGVGQALAYAQVLGVRQLNCLAGLVPDGFAPADIRHTMRDNLRYAAGQLERHGMTLLLEPINTYDVPRFMVSTLAQGLDWLKQSEASNMRLQYDLYHGTRMGEDVAALLRQHLPHIGHVQIADVPGRHEPGTGHMPYGALLSLLDELGYEGYVGCEYVPLQEGAGGTQAGLGWIGGLGLQA